MDGGAAAAAGVEDLVVLRTVSAGDLARVLRKEAPQTVAAVMMALPSDAAAALFAALDPAERRRAARCLSGTRRPVFGTLATVDRLLGAEAALRTAVGRMALDRMAGLLTPDLGAELAAALRGETPPPPGPAWREEDEDWIPPDLPPGIAALVNGTEVAVDRMPMLEVVFDRFVRLLTTSLRDRLGATADVSLLAMRSLRFGDWLNGETGERPLIPFRADPWDGFGLLAPDRELIEAVGESLLGGDPVRSGERVPVRPLSDLDLALMEGAAQAVLNDLGTAFEPIAAVRFKLDRVERFPRFATIARPFGGCMRVRLGVSLDGRAGGMDVILPHALLEPVRPFLRAMFMGERFGKDTLWQEHLRTETLLSRTVVRAVAGGARVSLADLLALRSGSVIALEGEAGGVVRLEVGDRVAARGRLGASAGRRVVAVEPLPAGGPALEPLDLPQASPSPRASEPTALLAARVRLTVIAGAAECSVEELLRLARGGLLQLDRRLDEPLDICAEDRVVGRGELVALDGRPGVRLITVAAPA